MYPNSRWIELMPTEREMIVDALRRCYRGDDRADQLIAEIESLEHRDEKESEIAMVASGMYSEEIAMDWPDGSGYPVVHENARVHEIFDGIWAVQAWIPITVGDLVEWEVDVPWLAEYREMLDDQGYAYGKDYGLSEDEDRFVAVSNEALEYDGEGHSFESVADGFGHEDEFIGFVPESHHDPAQRSLF